MTDIHQVETPDQAAAVRTMVREYLAWTTTIERDALSAPTFEGIDEELATLPGIYAPPAGRLLMATHDGAPAGCIALKPHDRDVVELKRLYVRPGFRGHHIGERLVNAVVDEARRIGYKRIVLNSHMAMTTAHALYRAAGFRTVDAPAEFPEHLKPTVVFMERDLD